jgi:alpha,alpha-trehalase
MSDSPAVFARLLDDSAGLFRIAPGTPTSTSTRRYRPSSLVLDTMWSCPEGDLLVTDAIALGARERGHELGLRVPGVLLRYVRCTRVSSFRQGFRRSAGTDPVRRPWIELCRQ